jgi:hypothetical protein
MRPGTVRPARVPAASFHRCGANWLRFAQLPSTILVPQTPSHWAPAGELGSFCAICNPQSRNWVRFAHLPRVPCPCGPSHQVPANKLGSFCTSAGRIGFVLHNPLLGSWPTTGNWVCFAGLGWFRTIGIGLEWWNDRTVERWGISPAGIVAWARAPMIRIHGQDARATYEIGFVLHNRPPAPVNWVCFARMPLTGIGFVLHDRLAPRRPPDTPARPSLALFRMFSPWRSAFLRARRNWLCLYGIPPTDCCLPITGYRHLALFRTNTHVSSFRLPITNMSFPRRRES